MLKKSGFTHDSVDNKTIDWYTPSWIFEELGIEFDLDPCSKEGGISWIPAKNVYSIKDDGLTKEWHGSVWLNPPYGKQTPSWLERMSEHRDGIALVFSRTDCRWFHDYIAKSDAMLFLKGRVKFIDGNGVTGNSGAGSGSLLAAWGRKNVNALVRMRDRGYLVIN